MPGYFRDRQATGVHDPLRTKVLFLSQGEQKVALVACDLIGMGSYSVARIRAQVREIFKDHAINVWIHATHTHTGGMVPRSDGFTSDAHTLYPDFYPGKVNDQWVQQLVDKTSEAVVRAAGKAATEEKLTLHSALEKTVAHYRRYVMKDGSVRTNPGRNSPNIVRPAGEIDPRVHVLKFETNRILMVIYGLHPDCVGGTKYSADFPHAMTEVLRHSLGADWQIIFFNACCGNINHININDPKQKSGPEESQRIGQALALAVLEALKKEQPWNGNRLLVNHKDVACRLRKPNPADLKDAEELLRTYKETGKNPFGFNELYAPAAVVLAKTKDREHQAEIAALRLGSFGMAFLPGEIFVELGREIEAASPFHPTRTIGLTNGSMGYIPTRRAYAEGGYEAGYRSARYEPENGHNWAKAAAELLREMN
jgi:hypothetical protein